MISDSAAVAPRVVQNDPHSIEIRFSQWHKIFRVFFNVDFDMDVFFYLWRVSRYGNFSITVRTIEWKIDDTPEINEFETHFYQFRMVFFFSRAVEVQSILHEC